MTKKNETKKQPSNEKVESFTRDLLVTLTREELEARSQRMTHIMVQRQNRADEIREERKEHKRQLNLMDLEIRQICNEVRAKSSERSVNCERRFLYEQKKVIESRADTGELLSERPMTLEELALELPFGGNDADEEGEGAGGIDTEFGGDALP